MAWWDRHLGVLDSEIDALEVAGLQPQMDSELFATGKVTVKIRLMVLGEERDASVSYPDFYPYFRPILRIPGLGADLRHYDPYSGEICLLKKGTQHWMPSRTAADHINEMLPHWEKVAGRQYSEPRLEIEDRQAEPASVYYPSVKNQQLLLDSHWRLPQDLRTGYFKIALPDGYRSITPTGSHASWVTEILDDRKKTIEGIILPEPLRKWIKGRKYSECTYPWIRLDAPPFDQNLVQMLISSDPKVEQHVNHQISVNRSGLFGFCFPEESPTGGYRDGWLFLAYHCERKGKKTTPWLIAPDYVGEKDLFERVTELHPLRDKIVAVVGLGCVGAPSALAFARAGVGELRLLDGDVISVGTLCRWPLGLPAIGMEKVIKLTQHISENYPFTQIGISHYPYGNKEHCMLPIGELSDGYDQFECLEKMLEGADIIYDATAELGINLLLNDLAITRNIPYISVSSRTGGWGGSVVRVSGGSRAGCLRCYLYALHEDGTIPQPPYDPNGDGLQPVGCGSVTFKAAGFDVEEIALAGVRMAVSTLSEGHVGAYPTVEHDIGILSLRKDGKAIFPEWWSSQLQKHPKCEVCNR